MPLPLAIQWTIFQKLTGAAPDFGAGTVLSSVIACEYSTSDRGGFEKARITIDDDVTLLDEDAALAWVDSANLMRPLRAYDPDANVVWEGRITGVTARISGKTFSIDLDKAANYIICHYQTGEKEEQKTSAISTNDDSIDAFGRRTRILSLDNTSDDAVIARIETAINEIAFPQAYEQTEARSDALGVPDVEAKHSAEVTLYAAGVYTFLDQVTFSEGSTALTDTDVQIAQLLTDYAAVNPFFDPDAVTIMATGVAESERASEDSTYKEKIEKLLAVGNTARVRMAWGFYEDGFRVVASARATPATISYREYTRTGLITDDAGAVLFPWQVRPNAMSLIYDVTPASPPSGAVDGPARKYVARVRVSIDAQSSRATLEPGNDDPLDALLAHPVGNGATGTDGRTSAIARSIATTIRPYASPANGRINLGGGQIDTGGGNIDTGGGTIYTAGGSIDTGGGNVINTGGAAVDLGTGAGIGSSGGSGTTVAGSTGTADQLIKWGGGGNTLADSGMTVDTTGAADGDALVYDNGSSTWIPGTVSTGSGTVGVLTRWAAGGTSLEDADVTHTGAGALRLDTNGAAVFRMYNPGWFTVDVDGSTTAQIDLPNNGYIRVDGAGDAIQFNARTLTLDGDLRATGVSAATGQVLRFDGTTFAPAAPSAVFGTGTAGRVIQWGGAGNTLVDSTLIKSGAGVLTLSSANTQTITFGGSTGGTLTLNGTAVTFTTGSAAATFTMRSKTLDIAGDLTVLNAGGLTVDEGVLDLNNHTLSLASNDITIGAGTSGKLAKWTGTNTLGSSSIDESNVALGSGATGRVAEWGGTTTLQASTLIKSGAGVLTIAAASTQTLTIGGSTGGTLTLNGSTATFNSSGTFDMRSKTLDLAGNLTVSNAGGLLVDEGELDLNNHKLTLSSNDISIGAGTSGKLTKWTSTNTLGSSSINESDVVSGSGTSGYLAIWAPGGGIQGDSHLQWDAVTPSLQITGVVSATDFLEISGNAFDIDYPTIIKGYTASTSAATGHVDIEINGTVYHLLGYT